MATRGWGLTYPLRASISRIKAMVFRKSLTFFRYELGRKQRWTTYLRQITKGRYFRDKFIHAYITRYYPI